MVGRCGDVEEVVVVEVPGGGGMNVCCCFAVKMSGKPGRTVLRVARV